MKPAARNGIEVVRLALAMMLIVVTGAAFARANPPRRDLLAHGNDQYFWSVDVTPVAAGEMPATVDAVIRYRTAGELRWQKAGELSAQPVSLANRGSELLIV